MTSISRSPLLALVAAAGLAALAAGCNRVECGEGTIEMDGVCIASVTPGAECAPGTTYNSVTGRCESDLFDQGGGLCGPNTTQIVDDAGVRICQGTGSGGGDCTTPLPCPASTMPNTVSLCGRIFDLEDSSPLDDGVAGNGEPHKTVEVRVIDPLAFINNPNPELLAPATVPDACGRFAIVNARRPPAGFIAVATEDVTDPGTGQPQIGDNLVIAGVADAVEAGQVLPTLRAWIFRRSTDAMWSTAAGLPSGQTFGSMGVYVPIFLSTDARLEPFPAVPTPDVMVAILDPSGTRTVDAARDYYFDDSEPLVRRAASGTRAQTGTNGTALFIMAPGLGNFSGLGNTPDGVCWAINPAAAPPGGAFVQERTAESRFCP